MWLFGRLIDRLFGCSIDWSLAGCMYSVYIVAHNVVRPVHTEMSDLSYRRRNERTEKDE